MQNIGRRGAAVQLYQSLGRDILRTELNTEPEPETQSLFAELSNGKELGALAAARENRPAVSTGTVPPTPASSHGVSHPTASVLLWSRFTVPRWIALTAAIVAIVFFSFQWLWPSQRPETSRPLGLSASDSSVSTRDIDSATYEQFLYAKSLVLGQMGVFGPQPMVDAATSLEQIIARYPNYAPAWAMLAQVYDNLPGCDLESGLRILAER